LYVRFAGCCSSSPKHVEQAIRSAIKIHLLHLVGILFPHIIDDAGQSHIKLAKFMKKVINTAMFMHGKWPFT
jgi:hypothetical protein